MSMSHDPVDALARAEDANVVHVSQSAVSAIVRSEVEAQLDAAHKYRRSISHFLQDAKAMACLSLPIAESCMYSLPRGGKLITGPSVRLAEICASAYGNLQVGARVVDTEDKEIVAQGAAWDMEKNLRATIEVRRRITNKQGRRYDDDMITMTGNAAASIALRNAIFRVIPRAYVDTVYEAAKKVALGGGDQKTFGGRRDEVMLRLQKLGVVKERVLALVERAGVADITMDDLEKLIGLGTAIKNGDATIDEAFPEPTPAPAPAGEDGKRISLRSKKAPAVVEAPTHDPSTGEVPADQEPPAPNDPEPGSAG